MNSNPKPNIKVYVTIQLCDPYAELYYIARRLKHHKVISNYRLDENGSTQIALSPTTQSFKFTGLDQLAALHVTVPPQINDEINYRRAQIQQNEEKARNLNLEKARKARPNLSSSQQTSSSAAPSTRTPLTGSNSVPVQARVPSTSGHGHSQALRPAPYLSTGLPPRPTYQQLPNTNQEAYSVMPWNPHPSNQPPMGGESHHQSYQSYKSPPSYQQSHPSSFSQPTPSNLRTKAVKRPNQSSSYISPPTQNGNPVTTQATFRFPPPGSQQDQSPQFPYPQSYWTTPPPGVGVYAGGATVPSSTQAVRAGTRLQSQVINSSDWMDVNL